MKLSDAINQLQDLLVEHGDLPLSIDELSADGNVLGKVLLTELTACKLDKTLQYYGCITYDNLDTNNTIIKDGVIYKNLGETIHLSLHS